MSKLDEDKQKRSKQKGKSYLARNFPILIYRKPGEEVLDALTM